MTDITDCAVLAQALLAVVEDERQRLESGERPTNLATIISEQYRDTEDLDGIFSGWNEESHAYKNESWQYDGHTMPSAS